MKKRTDTTVCPPDHEHAAKSTCYRYHFCRCLPCRVGNAARSAENYALRKAGTPRLVDAQPVREHVRHLQSFGLGNRQIAALAGVSDGVLTNILWGHPQKSADGRRRPPVPAAKVRRESADAILSVRPDPWAVTHHTRIPSRGTQRRIQALATLGWTLTDLGPLVGMSSDVAHRILKKDAVFAVTHWEFAKLYDELWNVAPPRATKDERIKATRMVRFAAARRWLPPLAWDDIDNDPTPPVPDGGNVVDDIAVELVIGGETGLRLNRAERHEVVRHFHALRWSDGLIADRVGVDERTILRDREELGLEAFDQTELLRRDAA
ncbi:hypothetical protein ACF1AJ_20620 [Leifsonia sp. NPDC014704]|uniref:hypothetical protein n=1 Tax=Leifsonia sp. NPDC014704 TaxID=3364123 RepID=UPI0036F492E6